MTNLGHISAGEEALSILRLTVLLGPWKNFSVPLIYADDYLLNNASQHFRGPWEYKKHFLFVKAKSILNAMWNC